MPGTTDQFLINAYGMLQKSTPHLIKVDIDGNTLLNASDYDVASPGFVIHSAIHMSQDDCDCVAHTTRRRQRPSAMECELLPLAQNLDEVSPSPTTISEGVPTGASTSASGWSGLGDKEAFMILRNMD